MAKSTAVTMKTAKAAPAAKKAAEKAVVPTKKASAAAAAAVAPVTAAATKAVTAKASKKQPVKVVEPEPKEEEEDEESAEEEVEAEEDEESAEQEDSMEDAQEEADEDEGAAEEGDEEEEAAEEEDVAEEDAEEDEEEEEEEEEKPVSKKRAAESAAQSAAKKTKSDAAEPATTIFLGNLPWSADEDSIAAEFADCGEVTSVRLHVDRKTQRKKGFAHVTFATKEGAKAAVELGSKTIDGRDVRIDFAAPAPTPSTPRPKTEGGLGRVEQRSKSSPTEIVFVANLPFSATEDALAEFFGEHGTVVSTRIPTDRESGRPKGFAHVTFASVGDAKAALEALNGADFGGRTIRLDFSSPRDRSSGGGGGGFGGAGRGGRGGFGGGRGGNGGFGGRDGGSRGSGRGGRQRF